MIIQDLVTHKDDHVAHSLIVTGPDPVALELPGLVGDNATGELIQQDDLLTTQEEADTIIVQQVKIFKQCVLCCLNIVISVNCYYNKIL